MSFLSGTNRETIYESLLAGTAKNTFTTEVQINDVAGMGVQASLPPNFWAANYGVGKAIHITARGILSSTATPTYTFSVRLGAAASITAVQILASAALTTASGVTNAFWELQGDVVLTAFASGASTVRGMGTIISPGLTGTNAGINPVFGGGASPGTVATLDTTITNFVNLNAACSASSASNSIQLLQLIVEGLN